MTKQKHADILNTQTNTNEVNNSTYSLINEPIDNTPFRLVGNDEKGYCLAVSNHIITAPEPSREKCLQLLNTETWNITTKLICVIIDKNAENESKSQSKNEN